MRCLEINEDMLICPFNHAAIRVISCEDCKFHAGIREWGGWQSVKCNFKPEPPEPIPEWLKEKIIGRINLLKKIPQIDGQWHGNMQALEWVLSLRKDES